ncbi:MAG: hypothetical protein HY804_07890 [Nitrospinae bacterium]|nr:hypothetical protein [Nitrospinota bacterium]
MNQRTRILIPLTLAVALAASGCATEAVVSGGGGPTMEQAQAIPYDGPKARLAVVKFIDKTAKGAGQIGDGMSDMLTTALFNTNRFIMLDREDLNAVVSEQDFAEAGRVSGATAAQIGALEGAELLVMGAVTEFEPDYIGAGGILVGAVTLGASIAIASSNKDAPIGAVTYMDSLVAIDLKIVDARTGRIVYAGTVRGDYKNWGGGIIGGVGGGDSRVPVGLGGWAGTGVEQAIRVCIRKAAADIVARAPGEYYRYGDDDTLSAAANRLMEVFGVELPGAVAENNGARQAYMVDSDEAYGKLLGKLGVDPASAPAFDWRRERLVAVFGGKKTEPGWRAGVDKAVEKSGEIEITLTEAKSDTPPPAEGAQAAPEAYWPFEVARIENADKPARLVWR